MKLMFDIGANNGDIALHFSRFTDKVIAFEPNPNLVSALQKRLRDINVVVDTRAVSDSEGTKQFNICDAPTLSSFSDEWIHHSRFSEDHYWAVPVNVTTCTLDSIIDQYGTPEYVKIDVEGHECEVLKGLTKLLPGTVFCFEWVEEHWESVLQSVTYLQSIGYNQFVIKDEDGIWMDTDLHWTIWPTTIDNIVPDRKERWGMIYFKNL